MNSDEYKQSECIKARNHTLLDFLHLFRNRYLYLRSRASKVGMLHWTWWLLALAFQGKLYRALQPKLYATRNLCMHGNVLPVIYPTFYMFGLHTSSTCWRW